MKLAERFLLILCLFLFFPPFDAFSFDGPLQVKNQYPLFRHANQPYIEKSSPDDSFSLSLSHSSTYLVQRSREWYFDLDMEITELNFRYKKNIRNLFEFGLDVPLVVFSDGFMDGSLEWYHDRTGSSGYGRKNRPQNEFLYEVRRNGNPVIKGATGLGLGDVRLTGKKPLISADNLGLSIKGDLELPTGNAKKGYGNGDFDAGVSILIDGNISKSIMTYWNIGYVFPGDVEGYQKINLRDFVYGGIAIEADIGKGIGLLAQIQGQSPIYPKTNIGGVDSDAWLFSVGGRYRNLEISFSEDVNTAGAPDFTVNLAYKISL